LAIAQVGKLEIPGAGLRQVVEHIHQLCAVFGTDANAHLAADRVGQSLELAGV